MPAPIDQLPDFRPTALPVPPGGMNPVQRALDDQGVPWRTSTRDLVARFGSSPHPSYDWDVIPVAGAGAGLEGMIFPIAANAFRSSSTQPPDLFFTCVWVSDDPLENIRIAAESFCTLLGPAEIGRKANTVSCAWTAGPAGITLTVWPPSLQSFVSRNRAHERDPRLVTACRVAFSPGYRRAASEREARWIDTAFVVLHLPGSGAKTAAARLATARPLPTTVEFARDPVPRCAELQGTVSLSQDGAALIVCDRELLVIPLEQVLAVAVRKLSPAKGPGGSWLELVCQDPASAGGETAIRLASGRRPDELDAAAHRLGERIARRVRIEPAQPDV